MFCLLFSTGMQKVGSTIFFPHFVRELVPTFKTMEPPPVLPSSNATDHMQSIGLMNYCRTVDDDPARI